MKIWKLSRLRPTYYQVHSHKMEIIFPFLFCIKKKTKKFSGTSRKLNMLSRRYMLWKWNSAVCLFVPVIFIDSAENTISSMPPKQFPENIKG